MTTQSIDQYMDELDDMSDNEVIEYDNPLSVKEALRMNPSISFDELQELTGLSTVELQWSKL
jgi:hypothetical protein